MVDCGHAYHTLALSYLCEIRSTAASVGKALRGISTSSWIEKLEYFGRSSDADSWSRRFGSRVKEHGFTDLFAADSREKWRVRQDEASGYYRPHTEVLDSYVCPREGASSPEMASWLIHPTIGHT